MSTAPGWRQASEECLLTWPPERWHRHTSIGKKVIPASHEPERCFPMLVRSLNSQARLFPQEPEVISLALAGCLARGMSKTGLNNWRTSIPVSRFTFHVSAQRRDLAQF